MQDWHQKHMQIIITKEQILQRPLLPIRLKPKAWIARSCILWFARCDANTSPCGLLMTNWDSADVIGEAM